MSGVFLALSLGAAQAQISDSNNNNNALPAFPSCTDHRGETVQYIERHDVDVKPSVSKIAVRYLNEKDIADPAIIYDEDFLQGLSRLEFDFTMAHECYHLSSGDAYRAYQYYNETLEFQTRGELQNIEDDADCRAAIRMREEFGYSRADIESLEPFINRMTSRRKEEARMQNILACYGEDALELVN